MAKHTRNPWPKRVVWNQSGRPHDRFYWLSVPPGTAARGQLVRAEVKGQRVEVQAKDLKALTLRLSDELLDLDAPVIVTVNGEEKFSGELSRSVRSIWYSLLERPEPRSVATAVLRLTF